MKALAVNVRHKKMLERGRIAKPYSGMGSDPPALRSKTSMPGAHAFRQR